MVRCRIILSANKPYACLGIIQIIRLFKAQKELLNQFDELVTSIITQLKEDR